MRERVHLLGPVPVQVKNWLMGHARTLAYPSLDEGFGFPVLEAHAAGVPVVASSAGSIPEVAGDAAILVDTHDIDGFATALTDMCRDGAHREALIAAGVANLARFDWTRTVDALVALYGEAVNTDTGGHRP
jgi:glycosyltransferase involved in cell wall biosynthesis